MKFKKSITLIVVATLSMTIVASGSIMQEEQINGSFQNFMGRSNDLMARSPLRSTYCFNQYIELIDEIAKTYQRNHDACIQASIDGRSQAEATTVDKRNKLASSANSSCNLLNQCSEIESSGQVFECYVAGGSENARTMYVISADASEHLSDLKEQFHLVESREYKCTNETKRQYEKDSVQAYDKFNKCNLGITESPEVTEAPAEIDPTEEPEFSESTENPLAPVETEPSGEPEAPVDNETPESDKNKPEENLTDENIFYYSEI